MVSTGVGLTVGVGITWAVGVLCTPEIRADECSAAASPAITSARSKTAPAPAIATLLCRAHTPASAPVTPLKNAVIEPPAPDKRSGMAGQTPLGALPGGCGVAAAEALMVGALGSPATSLSGGGVEKAGWPGMEAATVGAVESANDAG